MVKILYRIFTLLTISILLIAGCSAVESYIVGINAEPPPPPPPPFSYTDVDGVTTGFDVESIQWITEENGFEIEFVVLE